MLYISKPNGMISRRQWETVTSRISGRQACAGTSGDLWGVRIPYGCLSRANIPEFVSMNVRRCKADTSFFYWTFYSKGLCHLSVLMGYSVPNITMSYFRKTLVINSKRDSHGCGLDHIVTKEYHVCNYTYSSCNICECFSPELLCTLNSGNAITGKTRIVNHHVRKCTWKMVVDNQVIANYFFML